MERVSSKVYCVNETMGKLKWGRCVYKTGHSSAMTKGMKGLGGSGVMLVSGASTRESRMEK